MSAKASPTDQKPAKPPTPAQTAKPYGTAAKAAAAKKPSTADKEESAAATPNDNAAKTIEKLETKTKAINANNVARVANSQLTADDEKLHPLYSLKTGKPIEKFPTTSKDIAKLSPVDSMLSALEADRTGNEVAKKERLRLQIGLKPHPA